MSSKEGNTNGSMRNIFSFLTVLIIGIVIRILSIRNLPFDSDQAIVGLMGKHILEGALPWLYYGDSYCGILEPLLASWSFLFFGVSRLSLHLIPLIFSILFIISIYQLGREIFNREIALLSMLLAAVPLFSIGLYSSLAYGGYIEILWLGNIILLITHRLALQKERISLPLLFFLGLLWGISWWTYPISVVYLITSFCFLLYFNLGLIRNGKVLITASGFILGSIPFWVWNGMNRFPFFNFAQAQESPDFSFRIARFYSQLINFFNPGLKESFPLMTGFSIGLFILSLLFLLAVPKRLREKFPSSKGPGLLFLFFLSFGFAYIGSRFSEQNASRYLLPLSSLIPITLALFCYSFKTLHRAIYMGMVILVLVVNIFHQSVLDNYLTTHSDRFRKQLEIEQAMIDFLKKEKLSHVYALEYWSAAKLTFDARENPVFCLPFKDRYPLYTLRADAAQETAFILEGKYWQSFEEMFKAMGGTYNKKVISPYLGVKGYVTYYNFKPPQTHYKEICPIDWKGNSDFKPSATGRAFDRNMSSSWTSSSPQQAGMFFQIDLGRSYELNRIVLLSGKGREWDFPANYRIELSGIGKAWDEIASVKNNWAYLFWSGGRPFWKLRDGRMEFNFPPREARYIRITLTGPAPQPWSIGEIFVYQANSQSESPPVSLEGLTSFLSKEKIKYIYADIGLSAKITHHTRGTIKCLQEDYDITHGNDYSMWGYNGAFPYFNKLKNRVDFSLSPAFVVAEENNLSFLMTMEQFKIQWNAKAFGDQTVYYNLKFMETTAKGTGKKETKILYWTGTHLLNIES